MACSIVARINDHNHVGFTEISNIFATNDTCFFRTGPFDQVLLYILLILRAEVYQGKHSQIRITVLLL